jgi:hypothetical protein
MDYNANAGQRRPGEYLLFAAGFIGFVIATGGVVLASVSIAATGAILLLVSISCFGCACRD